MFLFYIVLCLYFCQSQVAGTLPMVFIFIFFIFLMDPAAVEQLASL